LLEYVSRPPLSRPAYAASAETPLLDFRRIAAGALISGTPLAALMAEEMPEAPAKQ
jgi:hypothetical protein